MCCFTEGFESYCKILSDRRISHRLPCYGSRTTLHGNTVIGTRSAIGCPEGRTFIQHVFANKIQEQNDFVKIFSNPFYWFFLGNAFHGGSHSSCLHSHPLSKYWFKSENHNRSFILWESSNWKLQRDRKTRVIFVLTIKE